MQMPVGRGAGGSYGDHLEQYALTKGIAVEELFDEPPEIPEDLIHVWEYFTELNRARSPAGQSLSTINFSEIQAWSGLKKIELQPWEVDLIRELDSVWMRVWNARSSTAKSGNQE